MVTKRLPTEQRRQQIAEEALRLLATVGPTGLTLQALGDALGIRDASVLRHYKDKHAIVLAAVDLFGSLLEEDLPHDIGDPLRRVGAFFVRRLTKVRARPEIMGLAYNSRLRDAAGEDVALVDKHIQNSAQFLRLAIEEAQASGDIRADIPSQMWVWVIAGMMRGAAQALPHGLQDDVRGTSPERTWELLESILCEPQSEVTAPAGEGQRA